MPKIRSLLLRGGRPGPDMHTACALGQSVWGARLDLVLRVDSFSMILFENRIRFPGFPEVC